MKEGLLDLIVAEAPDSPDRLTHGTFFEEDRKHLVDTIAMWETSRLRNGEDRPVDDGHGSAILMAPLGPRTYYLNYEQKSEHTEILKLLGFWGPYPDANTC